MATYGAICEFDDKHSKWSIYKQRLNFYFEANGITDAKQKRAIFVSVVGDKTYETLLGLVAPKEPPKVEFDELMKCLDEYYSPTPNIIVERFKFYDCSKLDDETMLQYLTRLKSLSRSCRFGEDANGAALTSQQVLEENLRDKFVWEMKKDSRMQQRLLSETNLTYKKTVQIANAMELAQRGVECVSGANSTSKKDIHKLSKHKQPTSAKKQYHPPAGAKQVRKPCFRCGNDSHTPDECKFKTYTCSYCKKVGHIVKNCFAKKKKQNNLTVAECEVSSDSPSSNYELYSVINKLSDSAYKTDIIMDQQPISMEIDTGAAVSIMNKSVFEKHYAGKKVPDLVPSQEVLHTYTGETIPVLGIANINISAKGKSVSLPLIVVGGDGPSLIGRNWLNKIKIDWNSVNNVSRDELPLLREYAGLFDTSNSPVKDVQASIHVPSDAKPLYYKARPIPYALTERLDTEIDRLLTDGIIVPVKHSNWAAPVVPVMKSDKSIRLCGDYKITVNKVADTDNHPIPKISDLYAKLGGGKWFSRLDMRHAYEQLELDENSRKYVTINTHRGLFTYTRLPYGVAAAPSIFQRVMDSMFQGMPNVLVYLDDILVSGTTRDEHLKTLNLVLAKLSSSGFHLKKEKCDFMKTDVVFLGHKVDATGLHPIGATLTGIKNARIPTCVTELRSFIGMVNHYARFIKGLSSKLNPLHKLLCSGVKWFWGEQQEKAFNNIKELLSSPPIVIHYDANKPLVLTTDASEYGIGAVLSHVSTDGTDQPIACYSRTLSKAEKNYSQLDKEGLAVIFGLKKSHQFVYGRHVTIVSDHKPLLTLFGENKQIPQMVSPRIQRWALMLATYNYTMTYKPGKDIPVADALSRLPTDEIQNNNTVPIPGETVMFLEHLDTTPVTSQKIATWTKRDTVLS